MPAFIGAAPYRRAKERGVKLIGATAHYITQQLDDGPIIEPDVVRVDHRHTVEDLARLGADVQRITLSRAVRWHCEDRVIRYGNQTVVSRCPRRQRDRIFREIRALGSSFHFEDLP